MRKKKDNKEKRNKVFLSIILVIFLVSSLGSVFLYSGNNQSNSFSLTINDKKYKFNQLVDSTNTPYFEVKSNDETFTTYYHPERMFVNIPKDAQSLIINSPYFYFTFDPNNNEVSLADFLRYDMRNNMGTSKFFIDSITNVSTTYNLPLITCNNASVTSPVVVAKPSNSTNVNYNNYCLEIEFTPQSTLQIRDILVYLLHDIEI
jgi:hypothetical protein